jgi:hypothetical protein
MTDQRGDLSTISRCSETCIPKGFLLISDAVDRLAEGMWGGLPRPLPVETVKQAYKKESVGFANWQERAGQRLTQSALRGELRIYVFVLPRVASKKHGVARASSRAAEPLSAAILVKVLSRLLLFHGRLPDHPIRPSIRTADGDKKLFALLRSGALVVRETEFVDWYQSQRAKGRWPSQRSSSQRAKGRWPSQRSSSPKRRSVGRPSMQTESLRTAVLALAREGAWNARGSITDLHRHLVRSGRDDVPSCDTLARLVDQLHDQTGELQLRRYKRSRRNP